MLEDNHDLMKILRCRSMEKESYVLGWTDREKKRYRMRGWLGLSTMWRHHVILPTDNAASHFLPAVRIGSCVDSSSLLHASTELPEYSYLFIVIINIFLSHYFYFQLDDRFIHI